MTTANLAGTLDAVETALAHLARQPEAAGFASGAVAYRQMADVVLGQRLWSDEVGLHQFDEQYARVGRLAGRVYEYLVPYQEVMARLAVIGVAPTEHPELGGLSELGRRLVETLAQTTGAVSSTRLGSMVGAPTSLVRRELDELVQSGVVRGVHAGGRTLFEVACGRAVPWEDPPVQDSAGRPRRISAVARTTAPRSGSSSSMPRKSAGSMAATRIGVTATTSAVRTSSSRRPIYRRSHRVRARTAAGPRVTPPPHPRR
jgi:hypothetical protein